MTNEKMTTGEAIAVLLFLPVLLGIEASVVAVLWRWFAVPMGAHSLGLANALGFSVLATVFTMRSPKRDDEARSLRPFDLITNTLSRYAYLMAIAAFAKYLMGGAW